MPGRQEVRRHFRLGKGFMATVVIQDNSGEFEIRNALSRSYYALFHLCHAWLAMKNVSLGRRDTHEKLIQGIRDKRGREFGERLEGFWKLRKSADYDKPPFFEEKAFRSDPDMLRVSAAGHWSRMKTEFDSYDLEVGSFLGVQV